MKIVTGITAQAKQSMFLVLNDGSQLSWVVEYRPNQLGWFANFEWQTWSLNGLRLTASPNLLRQWSNLLPFGIAIQTVENREPINRTDFTDGTATAFLLDATDVALVNTVTFSGN